MTYTVKPQVVHLYIDRLVLRGFQHEDQHDITVGIQEELTRMFSDPHSAQQLAKIGDVPRLKPGSVRFNRDTKPQQLGAHIAQGIGKGMK